MGRKLTDRELREALKRYKQERLRKAVARRTGALRPGVPTIPEPRRTWSPPSTVPTGGGVGTRSYDGRSAPELETTWRYNAKDPDASKFTPCSYRPRPGKADSE
jgi:hypothetical protein